MAEGGRTWRTWQLLAASGVALVIGLAAGAGTAQRETTVTAGADQATTTRQTLSHVQVTPVPTTPVTTVTTPTTTTTIAAGRSRTNPVPRGEVGLLPNPPWAIKVLSVTPNANSIVAQANQFNKPPASDRQFFMVRVQMTYRGQDTESPLSVDLTAVGASNVIYRSTNDTCGVVPDDYDSANRVFAGGTIEGNACWSVRTSDVGTLVMMAQRLFSDSGTIYFSLQ